MLGLSSTCPFATFESSTRFIFSSSLQCDDHVSFRPAISVGILNSKSRKRVLSTSQTITAILNEEDNKAWEACRQALSVFKLTVEEEDRILGKAFGQIRSPYWGEEREQEVPRVETVEEILNYLKSLGLTDDDLSKLLKKFPEVLGCNLGEELMANVQILGDQWGIDGKQLRNLLLRNPKVLGYNVDCKGDCIAKCTRCWVRF
ncbi:uncharacterized protein LOC124926279 isoform X1 [Impatiens glandulifera]|uniref:uncharacterized protein LOC124926279 isoform X1 n=1 Tax=Impatiens glandulifera TaxID=253017 RepID=UPI001FB095D2|nr:uncharacterized protein LOC124926279 isoform X1 [Impatiens glandulifera]